MPDTVTVGFLGLGAMGMATNLQDFLKTEGKAKGFHPTLSVWNRSAAKLKPLLDIGAKEGSIQEIALRCDVTFSMVFDDAAVRSLFKHYMEASPSSGAIFIDCSTVNPNLTKEHAALAQQHGIAYLGCPVWGRPDAAMAKQLLVASAGNPAACEKVRPLLEAMGRAVIDVGDRPELGQTLKLCGNFWITSMVELIAESMTLADKTGVPREVFTSLITNMYPGPFIGGYMKRMSEHDPEKYKITEQNPGFAIEGAIKDTALIAQLGRENGVEMAFSELVNQHMQSARQEGYGEMGELVLFLRKRAGLL
ncbi:hypothetical protein WJX74_000009 [Apatococcus lobatus]|uniref:Uncharacterized protein n=1 Tax=Apatococcus lobatus TaxID=904363 RepID=A0AAW1SB65_9CHLO